MNNSIELNNKWKTNQFFWTNHAQVLAELIAEAKEAGTNVVDYVAGLYAVKGKFTVSEISATLLFSAEFHDELAHLLVVHLYS